MTQSANEDEVEVFQQKAYGAIHKKYRTMKIDVPNNHEIGMRVPEGGSSCAKCEYVSADGKRCGNEYFVKWNGGEKLPAPANRYCCDFFEAKSGKRSLSDTLKEQKERK